MDLAFLIYSALEVIMHLLLECTSPTLSGISTHQPGRWSQLFGMSAQTDNVIRIWHSLYTLPEVIVPTSGVHLSNTLKYFYLSARRWSQTSLGSELRLTDGIWIWHSLYTLH